MKGLSLKERPFVWKYFCMEEVFYRVGTKKEKSP